MILLICGHNADPQNSDWQRPKILAFPYTRDFDRRFDNKHLFGKKIGGVLVPPQPTQTVVAMVTKICDFQHKVGYNLACAGDTAQMLARSKGFSGPANLMGLVKLGSVDPC